jgi:hypothetical protein
MSLPARLLLVCTLCCAPLMPVKEASAQPPHPPGTICFTPRFWCWLPTQLPPGSNCGCPTPYGVVPGRAG